MDDRIGGVSDIRRPLDSLISKSEKALAKVSPGTWQHTMLEDNVRALRIAIALMDDESAIPALDPAEAGAALRAFASMERRTEQALAKFSAGTSQHTLLTNRLAALRAAGALIQRAGGVA